MFYLFSCFGGGRKGEESEAGGGGFAFHLKTEGGGWFSKEVGERWGTVAGSVSGGRGLNTFRGAELPTKLLWFLFVLVPVWVPPKLASEAILNHVIGRPSASSLVLVCLWVPWLALTQGHLQC